ncbi:MAG TPA: hypothetical protein VG939_21785 [Caulobacteraceae bacterium]|nr:hypothetical protein [Caulobacteraceae bacterium]
MPSSVTALLQDRRVLMGLGGALALALGLGLAVVIAGRDKGPREAPPASQGGLIVQTGRDDDVKLDPKRPLRCFVGGKFVGELPLDECARRNGVASGALDVGVDQSGALAASGGAGGPSAQITPLPQPVTPLAPTPASPPAETPAPVAPAAPAATPTVTPAHAAVHAPSGACWRRTGTEWRKLPNDMTLNACLQALYAGHCAGPRDAVYGRWIDQTLRAVQGRIEISRDNHSFRTLVEQGPSCAVPTI